MAGGDPTVEALQALRARGVDQAEGLLADATPAQILAACRRWDGRQNVGPGLLAHWIRTGQIPEEAEPGPSIPAQLRARFADTAARFPIGTPIHAPHRRTITERMPTGQVLAIGEEDCPGAVRVTARDYPVIACECDRCPYDVGYPVAGLAGLREAVDGPF
jgi:hypothetical protein